MALTPAKLNTPEYWLENRFAEIKNALPRHVDPERIRRIALTELRKNDRLQAAANKNPLSFFGAVIQAAQLGLEPGSGLGHCYLIPYRDEVTFQLGYQGMIELVYRAGKVSTIMVGSVVEEDYFEHARTQDGEIFRHVPDYNVDERDETNIRLVYCVAKMKDGNSVIRVLTKKQVQRNEEKNRKGDKRTGPWSDYWEAMAMKTVLRNAYKYLPKSVELSDFLGEDDSDEKNSSEIARQAGLGNILDGKTGQPIKTPTQNSGQPRTSLGAKGIMDDIKSKTAGETDEES